MPDETLLPPDLEQAGRLLEARYQMLRVPSRKVPATEWESLPENIRKVIPNWIPKLLERYGLHGGV